MDTLGMRIAVARKRAGIHRQADFGERLGVSRPTVANWETGRTEPSQDDIKAISVLTGVDYEWLVSGERIGSVGLTKDEERVLGYYRALPTEQKLEAIVTLGDMVDLLRHKSC